METNVYLQQQQLSDLLQINSFIHKGVGFYWGKEGVIHAFTQFPETAPSGKPILVLFKKHPPSEALEECVKQMPQIESDLNEDENMSVSQFLCVFFQSGECKAFLKNYNQIVECLVKAIPIEEQLQSLPIKTILQNKKVVLVGLGALGFRVCKDLACAGVGQFSLFDFDRLNQSSISYHLNGWKDFGRFKTSTAKEMILMSNPAARVNTFEVDILANPDILEEECRHADFISCTTASHLSRVQVNAIALSLRKTTVFARVLRQHAGGEVFRFRADKSNAPCFACVLCTGRFFQESDEDLLSSITQNHSLSDAGFQFEFTPISSFVTRGIIANLVNNEEIYNVEPSHDYAFWANKESQNFQNLWNLIYPNDDTSPQTLRWLGLNLAKFQGCPVCGAS